MVFGFDCLSGNINNSQNVCHLHFILQYLFLPFFSVLFNPIPNFFLAFITFVTRYAAAFSPRLLSGALTRDQSCVAWSYCQTAGLIANQKRNQLQQLKKEESAGAQRY